MTDYRLCLVNSMRSWGGAEVWFLDTALALAERGLEVQIVAQPDSELLRRARRAGIRCAAIPIRFDAAPWTLARLVRYFRRERITALVANLTKDLKAAALAGRLAGVPIRLGTRESDFPLKDRVDYRWYFRSLSTGLLVNSESTRRTVLDSAPWLDPACVHLLYKGIDIGRFAPAPNRPAAAAPVVGFVGQLIERKGLIDLMEAWSRIEAADRPDAPILRLAGEGPLQERLQSWRATLRRPDRVELCGYTEDVVSFYHGCTLLVMPSLSEGFGLAAAEAAACGLPVVAARASSLPEIVIDGETGRLVAAGCPEELADAVTALLDDPEKAAELGRRGRERTADRFDHRDSLRRLVHLTGGPDIGKGRTG